MTVQCIECARLNLRESALARHGFGRCEAAPCFEFASATIERNCAKFRQLDAEQAKARREWLAKRDA